jgi:uncharacterized protein YeaO (DUF488 family)
VRNPRAPCSDPSLGPGLPMTREGEIRVPRIYDPPTRNDGTRVLVDRVWPRGLSKAEAPHVDDWLKDVAPSTGLRKWYAHDPHRFKSFTRRYLAELEGFERAEALATLQRLARERTLTLLSATKDLEISQAAVLADVLRRTSP